MKTLVIIAKRWFDKINGNTYHSVLINVDGKTELYEPFAYGYDRQYEQTAVKLLEKAYLIELKDNTPAWQALKALEESGVIVSINVIDVSRKRDL